MADDLTFRTAVPSDLAALDALYARAYPRLLRPDYPPSVLVTALPLIARAQPRLLASGTFHVAELGGVLVGAAGWTPGKGRVGDIRHVVTDDRQLRRGIGRRLMTRVIAEAKEAGMRQLDCQSTFTAVPFYRAMGFAELGPIEVELRPGIGFPAVRMQRDL